jgi:hypothetical protein
MCDDFSPMSKKKAITVEILGRDGKWKKLKTDSVSKGTKKLKKSLRQKDKDQSR